MSGDSATADGAAYDPENDESVSGDTQSGGMPPPPELSSTDLAMLTFERANHFWTFAGHHESAILEQFGVDMTTYHARLHRLIHRPEALAHDPLTVGRLLDREAAKRVRRLE